MRTTHEIELEGQPIVYTVRRSTRARRMSIQIDLDGSIEVVKPRRFAMYRIEPFLREHSRWVLKHHLRKRERPGLLLEDGESVALCGVPYRIEVVEEFGRIRSKVRIEGERIQIRRAILEERTNRVLLEGFLRRKAREEIPNRVAAHNERLCFKVGKISIRDQKGRWGSCASGGNLSFNWRLLLTPPAVMDYVVLHELCHIRVPNHSRRFWELVDAVCPGRKECEQWLRDQGDSVRSRSCV